MRRSKLASCIVLAVATACVVKMVASTRAAPVDQPLDTTAWVRLWSDDFDRAELGERWMPTVGQWSLEGGALKGVLVKGGSPTFELQIADVALLGQPLPETVEVQYETWGPDEIGSEAKLLNDKGESGLISALYGFPHRALQTTGAVIFVMVNPHRFETAALNRQFEFKPKDHYKVRIVRQPEGITTFVDGEQVASAAVGGRPESREPNLHLVGTFGKPGAFLFFDNLKIRVPPTPKAQ